MSKKIISRNTVKEAFSRTGFGLILYLLFILYLPQAIIQLYDLKIITSDYDYHFLNLIIFFIVIFGTFIPFFLIQKIEGIKFKDFYRPCHYTFLEFISDTCLVFTAGTAIIYFYSIILQYFNIGVIEFSPIGIFNDENIITDPFYVFLFIVGIPIVEEFAFRGVLLRNLGRYGNWFAIITISLIYAIMYDNFFEMIQGFFLSYILVKMTLRYRSIQPAIIVHIIFNLLIHIHHVLPLEYNYIDVIIIIAIYVLTLLLAVLKVFRRVRIINTDINKISFKLFYTRLSIILFFVLIFIYKIVMIL